MPTTEAVIGVMFVAWILGIIKGIQIGKQVNPPQEPGEPFTPA